MLPKLPGDFKNKWIAALTSGHYSQTRMMLFRSDGGSVLPYGFCPIGVAGAMVGITLDQLAGKQFISHKILGYEKLPSVLYGTGEDNEVIATITSMSDNGATFEEIATWIGENL